jgi:hypothetical protein
MEDHRHLTDTEFMRLFAHAELEAGLFTHEAHLRLAWLKIRDHGIEEAVDIIRDQLKNFVAAVGAQNKYHETLTVAAVRAVHHFMRRADHKSFDEFIRDTPELKTRFKELIASHYSIDIFDSEQARKTLIEPDVTHFD